MRERVKLTLTPTHPPPRPGMLAEIVAQLGSDEMLMYSSDYPHVHAEKPVEILGGLPAKTARKIGARTRGGSTGSTGDRRSMVAARPRGGATRRAGGAVIDTDVHGVVEDARVLFPFLPERWRRHVELFGMRGPAGGDDYGPAEGRSDADRRRGSLRRAGPSARAPSTP